TAESTETSAGLDAVGDERAIGGAAKVRLGEAAGGGKCGRGRGRCQQAPTGHRQAHAHGSAPVAAGRRGCPPIVTQRGRLCDTFVTVDKDHAPVGRVHGPRRAPAGKASCSISISPTVSEVTT